MRNHGKPHNVLVAKLRYVGDVLLATPVLRALRNRFPDVRLTMLVNRGTEDVLKGNTDLSDILLVDRGSLADWFRFLVQVRRRRFDCVVDLTDGDRSAILAWFSGAPIRVGFNEDHRWRGLLYTSIVQVQPRRVHRVERNLEALRPLGIETKDGTPRLFTSKEDEQDADRLLEEAGVGGSSRGQPLVMLHPGARYSIKMWPVDRFAELADRLSTACDCKVLVGGGLQDIELADAIRARTRTTVALLAGRTRLLTYAAILKRCALYVGTDNGAMQMATALGTPVVALFGPSDPMEWGPRGGRSAVVYKGLDCAGCFYPGCFRGEGSCMRQISVDEVFAAARQLLFGQSPTEQLGLRTPSVSNLCRDSAR